MGSFLQSYNYIFISLVGRFVYLHHGLHKCFLAAHPLGEMGLLEGTSDGEMPFLPVRKRSGKGFSPGE